MRPPSPSIPEREFLFKALEQSRRLDGRALLQSRSPTFTFGPELGWVECALGKTRCVNSSIEYMLLTSCSRRVLAHVSAKND